MKISQQLCKIVFKLNPKDSVIKIMQTQKLSINQLFIKEIYKIMLQYFSNGL